MAYFSLKELITPVCYWEYAVKGLITHFKVYKREASNLNEFISYLIGVYTLNVQLLSGDSLLITMRYISRNLLRRDSLLTSTASPKEKLLF